MQRVNLEYALAEEMLLCPSGVWRMGCGNSSSREQMRQEAEERGECLSRAVYHAENYCPVLLVSLTRFLVQLPSQSFSWTFYLGDASSKSIPVAYSLEQCCQRSSAPLRLAACFAWMSPLWYQVRLSCFSLRQVIRSLAKMECVPDRAICYKSLIRKLAGSAE